MADTVSVIKINPVGINKQLLTTDVGDTDPYRFRSGRGSSDTLRIQVGDNGSAGTWSVDLVVCQPGGDVDNDGIIIETYTSATSKVFEPGGDCDVYLRCTDHSGSSTLNMFIYKGNP